MLHRFFKKLNNKAFTLIEILLAVALLAIASVSIGAIIISTQNNTAKMFSEAELQQQLVEVQETLHNEILATNEGIKYWVKNSENAQFVLSDTDSASAHEKLVAFYNIDTKDYVLDKTYYKWNSEEKTLHVAKLTQDVPKDTINEISLPVDENIATTLTQITNWTLVSTNIESFAFDTSNYGKNRLVSFSMEVQQGESSYPTDDVIYLRNKIDVNTTNLTIEKYHTIELAKPTLQNTLYVYDGKEHGPIEIDYLERYIERVEGSVLTATDAGTYVVTYKLRDKDGTKWEDGSTADVTLTWTIQQRVVGLVWGETSWIYDGQVHATDCRATNVVEGDSCEIRLTNNSIGPNVGSVNCSAVCVNSNYVVPANNVAVLKITKQTPTVTINTETRTYSGSAQSMVSYTNLVGGSLRFYISANNAAPQSVTNTTCTATNAGTYYIWYKIVADNSGNYSDTDIIYLGSAQMKKSPTAQAAGKTLTYNGQTQVGVSGSGVIWTGETSKKNAGTYTAYAKPDANHLWTNNGSETKTITWTINKAAGAVTAPQAYTNLVYNGKSQTLVKAGSTPYGTVKYRLDNGAWQDTLPAATNAGTYTVSYYSVGDSNHLETAVGSISVTIARQRTAFAATESYVYDGNEHKAVNYAQVTLQGQTSAKNVGTYQYYATPTSNYAWSDGTYESISVTWTITKAVGAITQEPTAKTLTYNGSAQALVNAGSSNTGTMMYSLDGNNYSASIPTGTNAGDYTVYYYVKGSANYKDTSVKSLSITIARNRGATASGINKTYNGKAQTGVTGEHVIWQANGTKTSTSVGTYKAYATPESNYAWSDGTTGTRTIEWQILKASGSVTAPTAKDLTYNGSAQILINEGSSSTGTMYYKLSGGTYSTSLPSATNAGTYTVYYYSKGDSNHNDTEEKTIQVTIARNKSAAASGKTLNYTGSAQTGVVGSYVSWSGTTSATNVNTYTAYATPTSNYAWSDGTYAQKTITWTINKVAGSVTAPTAKSLTYNGYSQTLINAGSSSTGTMYYSLDGTSYSTSLPTGLYAGSYRVYYYSKGDANHNDTAATYITVTINRAKWATASAANKTYNGSAQTGVTGSYINWSGTTSATNAGTYTAYATPCSDCAWSDGTYATKTITWTMNRAKTASAYASNKTYSGSAQTGVAGSYVTWSGTTSATNAGSYTAYATPTSNYAWSDGGIDERAVTWTMYRLADHIFTVQNHTYDGNQKIGYVGSQSCGYACTWEGTWAATDAGTYYYYMTPDSNHAWTDGGTDRRTFTWYIYRNPCSTINATNKTYNGSSQTGITGWRVSCTGDTWATNAGTYTVYATPESNYAWSDGGTGTKTVSWTINRNPSASAWSGGPFTYTGSSIAGVSGNYVSWTGTTSTAASGTHTAYATPTSNYAWSDGTTGQRTFTWTINGYLFKVGNAAITRNTCKNGCAYNRTYNSSARARSHSSNYAENLSTDKQNFTIQIISDSGYGEHDSVTGPTGIGVYALHPVNNFYRSDGSYCSGQGWVPAENCEA